MLSRGIKTRRMNVISFFGKPRRKENPLGNLLGGWVALVGTLNVL
jgi:hypothetical protein